MELTQEVPEGYRREEERAFVLAADLGQSTDPTAIAVLEHRKIFDHHVSAGALRSQNGLNVRHLARLPLGLAYPRCAGSDDADVAQADCGRCELIIDETGVGRAVADIFDSTGSNPRA